MACFACFLVVHLVAWGTPVAAKKPKRQSDDGECAAALTPMQAASSHAQTSSVENTLHGVAGTCDKLNNADQPMVQQLEDGMPGSTCSCYGAGEHGMVFVCVKDQAKVFVKGPRGNYLQELLDERAVMKKMNDANVPCVPELMNTAEELVDTYPFIKMKAFAGETRPIGEEFGRVRAFNGDDWVVKDEFKYYFENATIAGKIKNIFSEASKHSGAHDEASGNFLVPTDLKADSACPIYIIDFPEYSYGEDSEPVSMKASWWKNCCYVKRLFSQLDCSDIPAHQRSQDYKDIDRRESPLPMQRVPYKGNASKLVKRKNDPAVLECTPGR